MVEDSLEQVSKITHTVLENIKKINEERLPLVLDSRRCLELAQSMWPERKRHDTVQGSIALILQQEGSFYLCLIKAETFSIGILQKWGLDYRLRELGMHEWKFVPMPIYLKISLMAADTESIVILLIDTLHKP